MFVISDSQTIGIIPLKFKMRIYSKEIPIKDVMKKQIAKSEDPDLGAVFGSALLAQTHLSENLRILR